MGMVKETKQTDRYSIYNGDCMDVVTKLPDKCIDLSIYSPPFVGLYHYSSDPRDFSNCTSREQFLEQYDYLVSEISRITKNGRISAVHCSDIFISGDTLYDFPHEVIEIHKKYHFHYMSRITVWKEPLRVRTRTMLRGLMHKMLMEDATRCHVANPDYILIFRRAGEIETPVIHPFGINSYAGDVPILPHMVKIYNNEYGTKFNEYELWEYLKQTNKEGEVSKLNHYIWQRYASCIWDDIRIDNVLPFRPAREDDDEKHVHPLQLDVIERIVELYSNPDEIVLTPFMGVGSEVYGAVKKGRKAIGIELKDSYYKQALRNLENVKYNDDVNVQLSLETSDFPDIGDEM
jgi:DNA modification methylase